MIGTPKQLNDTIRRARLIRVLLVYFGASFAVLEAVDLLAARVGLPGWVFPFSIVLLLLGLPIIVATALAQASQDTVEAKASTDGQAEHPAEAPRETTADEVAAVAKGWLTWRRAITGGVLAFALLGILVTGYMTMRVLGIGPVGSLVAKGVLDERERIILADFENNTNDPLLAGAVTEAFRVDFAQSPTVTLVQPAYVARVLQRMQLNPDEGLDEERTREVAIREGIKAVVVGGINQVGETYVLSARLLSTETGEELAGHRETAADASSIMEAVDGLSKRLRDRIGEPLKSINANEPLDRVTTNSLDALRKYSQAVRILEVSVDRGRAIALLEEAVALDTAFAMAYRKLAVALGNQEEEVARAREMAVQAYRHRDRLTEREYYLTLGTYYSAIGENLKSMDAYRSLLDIHPDDTWALNNLALGYARAGDVARAEPLLLRSLEIDSTSLVEYINLVPAQVRLGKLDEARATLERMDRNLPGNPTVGAYRFAMESSEGNYEAAEEFVREVREASKANPFLRVRANDGLGNVLVIRGHLSEAEPFMREAAESARQRGLSGAYLEQALDLPYLHAWHRGETERALREVEELLDENPLDAIPALDRPYLWMSEFYSIAGRPDLARQMIEAYQAEVAPLVGTLGSHWLHNALGELALADGRPEDAATEFRAFEDNLEARLGAIFGLARAFEMVGQADSAIAYYELYLESPFMFRITWDAYNKPIAFERLGALYETAGDTQKAIYYYGSLVDLWEDADPELQPRVESARRAISALSTDR